MGGPSTSYISFVHPSSTIFVPTNVFLMENLPITSGVSSCGSQFYSMRNYLHGFPSSGRNIYPHMSNPYHVTFSSPLGDDAIKFFCESIGMRILSYQIWAWCIPKPFLSRTISKPFFLRSMVSYETTTTPFSGRIEFSRIVKIDERASAS
jgi:hypothetical protein